MQVNYCPACGEECGSGDNFCGYCGLTLLAERMPAMQDEKPLSTFDGLHKLAAVIEGQQEWLRRNTLLEPLQRFLDNVRLRSLLEEASETQVQQILTGYQAHTELRIERELDRVRHARRLGDAEVEGQIRWRELEMEDAMAEREHRRKLERMEAQHQHERGLMELRAQLELVNAMVRAINEIQLLQLQTEAGNEADLQRIRALGRVVRESFRTLTEIDAGQLEYAEMLQDLGIERLEEAPSFELTQEVMEAVIDRVTRGVTEFGRKSKE